MGYAGVYAVSSEGRVRRETASGRSPVGHLLTPRSNPSRRRPRLYYTLRRNGRTVHIQAATLVADAFLGPRPHGCEINHRDGVPSHNAASNLEYVTRGQNAQHALRMGLRAEVSGSRNGNSKLTEAEVRAILASRESHRALARRFGVSKGTIWWVRSRRHWSHVV